MTADGESLEGYYSDFTEAIEPLLNGRTPMRIGGTLLGFGKVFESIDISLWSPTVAAGTTLRLREITTTKYRFGSPTLLGHVIGGEIMDKKEPSDSSSIMQTRWGVIMATGEMGVTQTFESPRFEPEEARIISEERFAHYGMDRWPLAQQWQYLATLLANSKVIGSHVNDKLHEV